MVTYKLVRKNNNSSIYEYWPQVLIGLSQITFGVAWASLFIQLDLIKVSVIILNLIISAGLIWTGWLIKKRL